jgi:hypothetical protein
VTGVTPALALAAATAIDVSPSAASATTPGATVAGTGVATLGTPTTTATTATPTLGVTGLSVRVRVTVREFDIVLARVRGLRAGLDRARADDYDLDRSRDYEI